MKNFSFVWMPAVMAMAGILHLPAANAQLVYPATKKAPVTDNYFGVKVTDNYRWMEDMGSVETQQWFKAQDALAEQWLDSISGRKSLTDEIFSIYSKSAPMIKDIMERNNRFFYRKGSQEEAVSRIYYRDGIKGAEKVLIDPAGLAAGKSVTVSFFLPSGDGSKLAFGLAENGKELSAIRIMDVASGKMFPEVLYPSWFGISKWTSDNKGFLYTRNMTDNVNDTNMLTNTKVMYHTVGTPESEDKEIFSGKKYPELDIMPRDIMVVDISGDNRYIIGYGYTVQDEFKSYIAPISELFRPHIAWKPVTTPADLVTDIAVKGDDIFLLSRRHTDRFEVLQTSAKNPEPTTAKVVIPASEDKIEKMMMAKDYCYLVYSDGINNELKRYNLATKQVTGLTFPISGAIQTMLPDPGKNDCIIEMTSWKMPPVKFDIDAEGHISKSVFEISLSLPGTEDIVVEEIEAPSYDGTMVPVSIFYNRHTKRDGNAICIISGYGCYGMNMTPFFHPAFLATMNKGVVWAIAHVRGGGEKGKAWHMEGYKATKANTWKDMIACAEYLISRHYTSGKHIIGHGVSAGGITIGRAITERPDLFAAAINEVGINNPVRFEQTPNGPNHVVEFGTVKDSADCMALLEMDSYQHVKPGVAYPAVITTVGMNDPRVAAWVTGKFAAALQQSSSSGKPALLAVNYNSGHFTEDRVISAKRYADVLAFALWQCGHPDFQLKQK